MILLPAAFEERMKKVLEKEYLPFLESLSLDSGYSIRFNPKKINIRPDLERVVHCDSGYYLPNRPVYTLDPSFHAGAYYVQESSSMFLEQYIAQHYNRSGLRVLDLCASPGGKSTHLASLLSPGSLLVSNEVIHSRAQVLSENLKKWGNENVVVTCNDPQDFARLPGFFDVIVVDAPCSGEGLFRKEKEAIEEWSEANAHHCSQRQKRILSDVWPALKEGGMLIYSTCTFNTAENEDNIKWLSDFSALEPVKLELPESSGIVTTETNGFPCYRFYPHKVKGEGFFISGVIKCSPVDKSTSKRSKSTLSLASKAEKTIAEKVLADQQLTYLKLEDFIFIWPTVLLSDLELIKANLRILHAGIKLGEIKRNDLIPAHELALSNLPFRSAYPEVSLTLEQAISFLKKDDFKLAFEDLGWNLLTYKNLPLGWAKNIGPRFNNHYPKEWRIRMSTVEFQGDRLTEEAKKFPLSSPNS